MTEAEICREMSRIHWLEGDFAPARHDGLRAMAIFGAEGLDSPYRYWLEIDGISNSERPFVVSGLNPSKATHVTTDNTIDKLIKFARRELCGRLVMTNAYPWRATDPADMWKADAIGRDILGDNDRYIKRAAEVAWMDDGIYVPAWGSHPPRERERKMWDIIRGVGVEPMCFNTNNDGSPTHPLYQPDVQPLRAWSLPDMPKKKGSRR